AADGRRAGRGSCGASTIAPDLGYQGTGGWTGEACRREPPMTMTHPPELSGGLPWLGHALEFRRNPVALLERARARFGDVFSFRLAGSRVTALTAPRAQAAFFQAPDDQLSAREVYRFMIPIFGRGVAYDAVPEVMDEQMGFFFPALREERLQGYA